MKKINNVLLVSFFVFAVFLFSRVVSPIGDIVLDNQGAGVYSAVSVPVYPITSWEFSGSTTTAQKTPTTNSQQAQQFGGTEAPTWTVGTGGMVGNYLAQMDKGNTAGNLTPSSAGWAVEFLMKPAAKNFASGTIFSFGNNFKLELVSPISGQASYNQPTWLLHVNGTVNTVTLDGIGRRSLNYIANDNWHHYVVQYDPSSSTQKIQMWIDGQLAEGYSFNQTVSTSGAVKFSSQNGGGFSYIDCNCDLDSMALYDKPLPPNLIVEHNINANAGLPYSTTALTQHSDVTDSTKGVYDPLDFMAGTNLSNTTDNTPGVSVSVIDQLKSYPLPRYNPSNTLLRNFSGWTPVDYMANLGSTSISGNSIGNNAAVWAKSKEINKQLATKWNYGIWVNGMGSSSGVAQASYELANDPAYLSIPADTVILRIQEYNNTSACPGSCLFSQNLPATHYLQNNYGQFLNTAGVVTTGNKTWRPISDYTNTPSTTNPNINTNNPNDLYYKLDGLTMKGYLQNTINAIPNRVAAYPTNAIRIINENGEIFPQMPQDYTSAIVNNDPLVKQRQQASGMDPYTYIANQFYQNERAYVNTIKSIPSLANSTFTEYALEADQQWEHKWSEAKKVNDPIFNGQNYQYYSTPDMYIRYPWNWRAWVSAWHGWAWIAFSRGGEINEGDNLFSPFISAGWDKVEMNNVRPAQMLGFSKAMAAVGAEFYYPGYFNIADPITENGFPENWAWQTAYPSYAQGVTSYYEDILRNGKLMAGDTPGRDYGIDWSFPGLRFFTNNPSDLVVARKKDGANKFLISGMENPWSNWKDVVPTESDVSIAFGGATVPATVNTPVENLKFKVRPQGSVYIYDKTGTGSPVFYQLDAWHERSHPWHWSKDFQFEAEVFDANTGTINRTTTVPAGTPAGDYRNFTTYINPSSGSTTYKFEPRDASTNSSKTYYAWALVKSSSGTSSGQFKIGSTSQTISTSSSSFVWCRAPGSYPGVISNSQHDLVYNPSSANFQVDKIYLTTDANLNLGTCGGGTTDHTAPVVVSITTSPVSTITTGPVTISATATDDVAVASVTFKVDGVTIGVPDTSDPYSASWSLTGVANGAHTITATATDTSGNVGDGTLPITVSIPDTTPPTTPTSLSVTRSGNSANLTWGASTDSGSGIAGYYVYRDGSTTALNTTAITGLGYTNTPTPNTNHTYTVKAKDNSGNFSTASNQVSINIDTLGPTISSVTPATGTYSGTITLSANTVSDPSMIDRVEFYRGGTTLICNIPGNNQTTATLTCPWDTTSVTNAVYSITAKAYDKATPANSTTSSANSITVNNVVVPPPDTTAPSIPGGLTATAISTTQINLSWSASTDNVGVTGYKVFRCTGSGCTPTTQIGTTTTTTYSNTGLTGATTYVYRVTANDAAGNNSAYSTSATATTQTSGQPDVIVTDITWSPASPLTGQNVVFSAVVKNQGTVATPAGVITGVLFNLGAVSSCADGYTSSIAPGASVTLTMGTGDWCAANTPASWNASIGTHTITATVDDMNRYAESNETNNTTSETLTVGSDTTVPMVSITDPGAGATITGGATVNITAIASDASGIQDVKIYIDGTQFGSTLTTSPYTVSWNTTGFSAGSHTITAVATDGAGNSATSSAVNVSILTQSVDTTSPNVNITSPNDKTNVSNSSPTTFIATATDNVGVTSVRFYRGNTNSSSIECEQSSPTTPPSTYSCSFVVPAAWWGFGWTTIYVQAEDTAGNISTDSIRVR